MKKRDFFAVSLTLFAMFFGAGNFIFPPMVGIQSGDNFFVAILFFCATAVLLPVFGVAGLARSTDLQTLTKRVDNWFSPVFVTLIYLAIAPGIAIPRASNLPFEVAIKPFINSDAMAWVLAIYSLVYFMLNAVVCINSNKIVDIIGKILTPILLIIVGVFFIFALINPIGDFGTASAEYASHPISTAFVAGYQTMDTLAALVFGIIVAQALMNFGVKDENKLSSLTIKAGFFAGSMLMIVYIMLGYIGAMSASQFGSVQNGAELLSNISAYYFGDFSRVILGIALFLACFTTTVGLISSISAYFVTFTKISYKAWVAIWCVISFVIANFGLNFILQYSVPILIALYPIAIVLVFLSLINPVINANRLIYRSCVYTAGIIGIIDALEQAGISIPVITDLAKKLPFYSQNLGWVLPVIFAFAISYIIYFIANDKDEDYS